MWAAVHIHTSMLRPRRTDGRSQIKTTTTTTNYLCEVVHGLRRVVTTRLGAPEVHVVDGTAGEKSAGFAGDVSETGNEERLGRDVSPLRA